LAEVRTRMAVSKRQEKFGMEKCTFRKLSMAGKV
jgi:hypothetical protein